MEKLVTLDNKEYTIPAIFSYAEKNEMFFCSPILRMP